MEFIGAVMAESVLDWNPYWSLHGGHTEAEWDAYIAMGIFDRYILLFEATYNSVCEDLKQYEQCAEYDDVVPVRIAKLMSSDLLLKHIQKLVVNMKACLNCRYRIRIEVLPIERGDQVRGFPLDEFQRLNSMQQRVLRFVSDYISRYTIFAKNVDDHINQNTHWVPVMNCHAVDLMPLVEFMEEEFISMMYLHNEFYVATFNWIL